MGSEASHTLVQLCGTHCHLALIIAVRYMYAVRYEYR